MKNETILNALNDMRKSDNSRLTLLKDTIAYLKTVSTAKVGLQALNNQLDEVVAKENFDTYYQNKVKGVFRLGAIIKDTKLFIIPDNLRMYNIEDACKLLSHIKESDEFTDADATKCKNKLNKIVFAKEYSTIEDARIQYNNEYKAVLSELFKEYQLEDDDDKKGLKLEQILNKMSDENKLAWLQKQLAKVTTTK